MKHTMLLLGVAILLAMSVAVVVGYPTSALSPDDELPASPPASSAPSPLLDALASAPSEIISFQFTDWKALKTHHGGSDIN